MALLPGEKLSHVWGGGQGQRTKVLTLGYHSVGQDADARQQQGGDLGRPPAQVVDGHEAHKLGRQVHGSEDDLDEVDAHPKALQVHDQPVVGEAGGEPGGEEGGAWSLLGRLPGGVLIPNRGELHRVLCSRSWNLPGLILLQT